jgi:hypothetical protein
MARTDITTTKVAPGTDTDAVAPATAIDQPNGMRILGAKVGKTLLIITNTSASVRIVTIAKGASQDNADQATTAIAVTTGSRFVRPKKAMVQADGGLYINFVAGHTGTITAVELQP